jgi:hypothetical protein
MTGALGPLAGGPGLRATCDRTGLAAPTGSGALGVAHVIEHPIAQWTAQQLVEAFPWSTAPRYLLQNRDAVYGQAFHRRVAGLGLAQVLTAPRSPWQTPYAERVIGSIRRECVDQVIVFSEDHLRRILSGYVHYYPRWRTHLSLVSGLHHHYERRAAGGAGTAASQLAARGIRRRGSLSFRRQRLTRIFRKQLPLLQIALRWQCRQAVTSARRPPSSACVGRPGAVRRLSTAPGRLSTS